MRCDGVAIELHAVAPLPSAAPILQPCRSPGFWEGSQARESFAPCFRISVFPHIYRLAPWVVCSGPSFTCMSCADEIRSQFWTVPPAPWQTNLLVPLGLRAPTRPQAKQILPSWSMLISLATGRSPRSPSPPPSRARGPSLARQATANSLATFLSSQSSSQASQNDRATAEDLLRDLIVVTESSSNAASNPPHGVKRPHDDDAAGEPIPKRDKLGEELDQMSASHPVHTSAIEPSIPVASSAIPPGMRNTIPTRATTRRLQRRGNGVETLRGGAFPEHPDSTTSSSDEGSEQLSDNQET
ncbi:hypothetical protein BT67DRAFT_313085 [Trichocladium antarcticum]|uniref:Uncharacterized protein n=1 Tax=Trichocladium antarcticum TaxID=1450529 RepID=A0AAN6UK51_9PEZI|nr:hypothetical protein BT67DRAFT_313085 [Trichocladium antarcticum]